MFSLIPFAASLGGYSLTDIAIAIVIIAAVCALVFLALKQFNVTIPSWVINIFWIVAITVCVVMAIRFVATL